MSPSLARLALIGVALQLVAAGCGGKLTPPPPPLRPKAEPEQTTVPRDQTRTDCDPTDHNREEPSRAFDERSPDEAADLARDGLLQLQVAEKEGDRAIREDAITKAVNLFITALLADPYNVTATYNLAAAYARINRIQCSLNLLERLFAMQEHHSRREQVADAINRLLGRVGKNVDPDFNDMRADPRFRSMISAMCGNARDATGCVYGAGKSPKR
ncbi:MAG: hypothetical protein R3B48_04295 [Kofleriaceae bacterium]